MKALPWCPRWCSMFILFFLLLASYCPGGFCSEAPIIIGSQSVPPGAQRDLWIQNYMSNKTYTWQLVGGQANLLSDTGEKITYIAPTTNPNCQNNPIIWVTCSDGTVTEYSIAVNANSGCVAAFRETSNYIPGRAGPCCYTTITYPGVCVRTRDYTCNGSYIENSCSDNYRCGQCENGGVGGQTPLGLCTYYFCQTPYSNMQQCIDNCILNGLDVLDAAPPGGYFDLRTEAMKTQGCCPLVSLPGYQKPPEIPQVYDKDLGSDTEPDASSNQVPALKCIINQGNPVSVNTGNKYETEKDINLSSPNRLGLSFKRSYNSMSLETSTMGYGWTHSYNVTMNPSYQYGYEYELTTLIRIKDETGRNAYFKESAAGYFEGVFNEQSWVTLEGGNYVWYRVDGSRYVFNSSGRLIRIEDEVGNRQNLAYDSNGRVQTVTDEASRRVLTFYCSAGLLDHVSGPVTPAVPTGIWVSYDYDGNQNLVSVTYADGSGFDYVYGDPVDVHNMTEKHDKVGHLISAWAYDASDRATEDFTRDEGTLSIVYAGTTEVTDGYGVTRKYRRATVGGRRVILNIDGPQDCPGCGEDVVRLSCDSSSRIIEARYANAMIKQFDDFDGRNNPQTVILAMGTPEEKTVYYTYHPDIDARLSETEPSLIGPGNNVTTWDYDDDGDSTPNENPTRLVHKRIEQGLTKDIAGNVIPYEYITTFTYNSKGQILTIDGPGEGTADLTTLTYNSTTGNLLTTTQPVVGTTMYSDYDAAGRVGRVTDPNGNAVT